MQRTPTTSNDRTERLVSELREVARRDWRKRQDFDFTKLPELTAILRGRSNATGEDRVPELEALLKELVERIAEYELTHPQVLDRSRAFAAGALLKLDDDWRDTTLAGRRDAIRQRWKKLVPGEGAQPLKSVDGFIQQHEIPVYRYVADELLDMTGDPPGGGALPEGETNANAPSRMVAEWPVERRPAPGQRVAILIAANTMRDGPTSPLVRLVREFDQYWRTTKTMVYAVDGSYREIWRSGLLHDYEDFVCLPAGFEGGLVYATEIVVAARQADPPPDVQVIYLVDPRDTSALYPETAEIKRECLLTRTPLLTTYRGAARWLSLEWARHVDQDSRRDGAALLVERSEQQAKAIPADRTMSLALAANDVHKKDMASFVETYADVLTARFPERYATYTTGEMLNGGHASGREVAPADAELGSPGWAKLLTRGREGGVVQLARKVLDDECGTVLFFQDAEREHDHEVRVLDRAAQLPHTDCMVLYDAESAARWAANAARFTGGDGTTGPITLVEAYRRVFGVELVLAQHPRNDRAARARRAKAEDSKDVWNRVVETGATYVLGAITTAVRRRRGTREPARVGLPWGGAIQDVVGRIDSRDRPSGLAGALGVQEFVSQRDGIDLHARRRAADFWPPAPRALGMMEPDELRVIPTVGLVGSRQRSLEAHSSVERVVQLLGGEGVSYPEYAFLLKDEHESPYLASESLRRDWRELDVLLLGAAPVRGDSDKRVVGLPTDLVAAMDDAHAIGTIYLRHGKSGVQEARNPGFWQTGISMEQVRELAQAESSEVVLIAGAQDVRERPAWAALKAGLASTFVTDLDFAWAVLGLEAPGVERR